MVELQETQPEMPTEEEDRAYRRAALGLAIQHRLGRDFPVDRLERLWAVQEKLEQHRIRSALKAGFRQILGRSLAGRARGLARAAVTEYARVLTPAELETFFGRDEVRSPALPVEPLERSS